MPLDERAEGWVRRAPQGVAKTRYSRPCPGCKNEIVEGDVVKKVTLKNQPVRWWHDSCRNAALATLRAQYQD